VTIGQYAEGIEDVRAFMRGGYTSLCNRAGDLSPQVSSNICAFYTILYYRKWQFGLDAH